MTPDLPQVEIAIVELTNTYRRQNAVGELRRNPALDAAARAFARYLAKEGTFSHAADGRAPSQRAKAAGYEFCRVAENLALNEDSRGFESRQLARRAVEGWIGSPGHQRNLVEPSVVEIGVGVARRPGTERYLSVQMFGRPASMTVTFKIRNASGETIRYRVGREDHEVAPRVIVTHTICTDDDLAFTWSGLPLLGQPLDQKFPVRLGDLFTIEKADSGRTVVRHQPRIQ